MQQSAATTFVPAVLLFLFSLPCLLFPNPFPLSPLLPPKLQSTKILDARIFVNCCSFVSILPRFSHSLELRCCPTLQHPPPALPALCAVLCCGSDSSRLAGRHRRGAEARELEQLHRMSDTIPPSRLPGTTPPLCRTRRLPPLPSMLCCGSDSRRVGVRRKSMSQRKLQHCPHPRPPC